MTLDDALDKRCGVVRLDEQPTKYSEKRFGDVLCREGRVAPTLTRLSRFFWDSHTEFGPMLYAAVGSFPSQFQFSGSHYQIRSQIGNSVPPLLMRSIALHLRELLQA